MTGLPMSAFSGKSLLGIEYDGNSVLLKFSGENRIVVYSGIDLSINNFENKVEAVEQTNDEIKLIFNNIEIKIPFDKEIMESFVAKIDGMIVVARD